ncbi:hypothetical protein [Arthrobacter crystallopoietes]|uniref:Uncharacterized protein n=1 Tax=Crystallibacter crystallopoietes TaxID=37928 RepID=A0A1H1HWJ4_9MICC|nr:hypothetical protein [Arthrobacter crystallopoietes]AUI53815.1 hypothetical protein AC20117_23050 [Arthrobacter crystallopoietes]SDR29852.1 hypothetical protein SAMN04489742_4739 [Arthrobacter crystallopoietes]
MTALALIESIGALAIENATATALKVQRWRSEETRIMTLQGPWTDLQHAVRELDFTEKPARDGTGRDLSWQIGDLSSEAGAAGWPLDKWLFTVISTIPADDQEEFEEWFDTEHIPLLLSIPGWRISRRYQVMASSDGSTHLTLHLLDGPHVLHAPERAAAANTGWASSLANRSWFALNRRTVYAPLSGTRPA